MSESKRGKFKASDLVKIPFPERIAPRGHVGDTVWLNSGGPPMIILEVHGDRYLCSWPGGQEEYMAPMLCAFDTLEFWKGKK